MKTTVEIPDDLFKRAKVLAAQEGLSMKQLITESLQQRVAGHWTEATPEPAWKQAFGAMRAYRKENRRIEKIIEQEFEQIEPEDHR
jgi:predicted transcriptional regulator